MLFTLSNIAKPSGTSRGLKCIAHCIIKVVAISEKNPVIKNPPAYKMFPRVASKPKRFTSITTCTFAKMVEIGTQI